MKKFSEKKRTVNFALLAVAVLGIAFGGFTAFTGHKMSKASAPALSSSTGSAGGGSSAIFGADFYTYIYDATVNAAINAGRTAEGVAAVNDNMQKVINAQYRSINNIGTALMFFGGFTVLLFGAAACTAVKINPCYRYDETTDKRYQRYISSKNKRSAKNEEQSETDEQLT